VGIKHTELVQEESLLKALQQIKFNIEKRASEEKCRKSPEVEAPATSALEAESIAAISNIPLIIEASYSFVTAASKSPDSDSSADFYTPRSHFSFIENQEEIFATPAPEAETIERIIDNLPPEQGTMIRRLISSDSPPLSNTQRIGNRLAPFLGVRASSAQSCMKDEEEPVAPSPRPG
jgi:hypothetical protein